MNTTNRPVMDTAQTVVIQQKRSRAASCLLWLLVIIVGVPVLLGGLVLLGVLVSGGAEAIQ